MSLNDAVQMRCKCGAKDNMISTNPSPTGTLDAGTTSMNISLTADVNATCHYSNTPNTNYIDMEFNFRSTNSTNHSTEVSGLENGNTYTYYLRCNSTDGYINDNDLP